MLKKLSFLGTLSHTVRTLIYFASRNLVFIVIEIFLTKVSLPDFLNAWMWHRHFRKAIIVRAKGPYIFASNFTAKVEYCIYSWSHKRKICVESNSNKNCKKRSAIICKLFWTTVRNYSAVKGGKFECSLYRNLIQLRFSSILTLQDPQRWTTSTISITP